MKRLLLLIVILAGCSGSKDTPAVSTESAQAEPSAVTKADPQTAPVPVSGQTVAPAPSQTAAPAPQPSPQRPPESKKDDEVAAYRDAPPSARIALNAVKKLQAKIEVGIKYADYSTAVGEVWGEVKVFAESPDGKKLPEFSLLLVSAITNYRLAVEGWQVKNKGYPHSLGAPAYFDALLQECWGRAGERLRLAESLLNVEKTEVMLETIAAAKKSIAAAKKDGEDFGVKLTSILDRIAKEIKDYEAEVERNKSAIFEGKMFSGRPRCLASQGIGVFLC